MLGARGAELLELCAELVEEGHVGPALAEQPQRLPVVSELSCLRGAPRAPEGSRTGELVGGEDRRRIRAGLRDLPAQSRLPALVALDRLVFRDRSDEVRDRGSEPLSSSPGAVRVSSSTSWSNPAATISSARPASSRISATAVGCPMSVSPLRRSPWCASRANS